MCIRDRYLETHCNIGSKRAFTTGVLDRWHNCLLVYWRTSCLVPAFDDHAWYLVSRACDWVMPALSAVLLPFSFQFSLLFCALTQFRFILLDDLAAIWRRNQATLCRPTYLYVMPYRKRALILVGSVFLCAAYIPRERLWVDFNGKNGN